MFGNNPRFETSLSKADDLCRRELWDVVLTVLMELKNVVKFFSE